MAAVYKNLEAFIRGNGLRIYRHTCPICNTPVNLQALVTEFGQPAGWQFYGVAGQRVKQCEGWFMGHWFTHIVTKLPNGALSHRLAWEKDDE